MALGERAIAALLRELTIRLQGITDEGAHGVLGGPDGYGCEYENDVFMMHPFCWCEKSECPWCLSCLCEFEERGEGGVTVEACRNCIEQPERAPNFLYKPTGARAHWYKYIGRGMEVEGDFPPDFLAKCLESLEGR